ncbi:MAG: hypothetical protein HYV96_10410 [Opitutae bacterium]|nr:hypothetical protein [Opitutae bacterium]
MKSLRLLLLATSLAGSVLIATAGTTSQLFRPGEKSAAHPKAAVPAIVACPGCKDTSVRATRFVGPPNRQQVRSVEVARKHSCTACGAVVASAHDCANQKTPGASCCSGRS